MHRILITPSGTEIALEIHEALCRRRDIELYGAESGEGSHADFVFLRNARVPNCHQTGFVDAINELTVRQRIDFIFPAHDDVQLALARAGGQLARPLISSPRETLEVTRFKSRTYELLGDSIPVPARLSPESIESADFPVFLKPDRGQGSKNTFLCRDRNMLDAALKTTDDMMVCEYLPGREVTVDCFSDRDAGLMFSSARLRARVRAGISVRSEPISVSCAAEYARRIASRLRLYGAWFFQLRERRHDEWVLLEIGARVAGGATYQRLRGVNLPLLSLFEHLRMPVEIMVSPVELTMDRAFISRFMTKVEYHALYVDFDDTLCLKGEPNVELVALIALARHRGKKICLISRNPGDCHEWLRAHRMSEMFDRVILIDRQARKSDYLESGALLIDDSFAERKDCQRTGALCLDTDAVGMLTEELRRR